MCNTIHTITRNVTGYEISYSTRITHLANSYGLVFAPWLSIVILIV